MGHYLKANKSTRTPSTFLFWDTETKPHPIEGRTDRVIHKFHLGYASSFRLEGGKMTRRKHYVIQDPFYFWDWVVLQLSKHRPVWMFAHNVGFDLTTSLIWEIIEQGDFTIERYVSEDPPTILKLRHERGSLVILDSMNWFRTKLSHMGNDIGMEKIDVDFATCSDSELLNHCRRDVEILEMRMFKLLLWLRENDLGVMQKTAPAQALQCFRHRFAPRTTVKRDRKQRDGSVQTVEVEVCFPLMHDDKGIAERERAAYFGGEARCFWIGKVFNPDSVGTIATVGKKGLGKREILGPIYHLDVNALYPYVMKECLYPCKYLATYRDMAIADLTSTLREKECIATVKLATAEQAFPLRKEGVPVYAVGNFYTSLCGDELRFALERGFVQRVDECLVYDRMDLFSEYVNFLWGRRLHYKYTGNVSGEKLCKLMLNSLYGKFGARAYKWLDRAAVNAKKPWGQWVEDGEKEGEIVRYRAIGWNTQEKQEDGEGRDSFVSIPACVTSNARQYMRRLRWIAGHNCVLYQHTDSLHVNQDGYDRLARGGFIDKDTIGKLKLVEIINSADYRGINNQSINGVNRTAGIKADAEPTSEGGYIQSAFASVAKIVNSKPPDGILVKTTEVNPPALSPNGYVSPDGWVTPYKIGV